MSDHADGQGEGSVARLLRPVAWLGGVILGVLHRVCLFAGGMSVLLWETVVEVAKGLFLPRVRFGREALLFQMVRVGVRAIPIVILVELALGMILPLQMFPQLDLYGQGDQVATVNAIAAFRELGPLMTAIVLSGFAGASIAAELGTMVTAEEIQALQAMALKPVRFLVLPRLTATVLMMVLLTVIANMVMVFGGWLTSLQLGIDSDVFYQLSIQAVTIKGFITGLVKAAVFGLLIGLISCFLGLSVKPWDGPEGVGRATTNTVVYCIVAIIGADAVFTVIFYAYGMFM